MSPVSYQLLYPAVEKMAEKEGFEPPRLLHPVGFQDRSLQPDLGISPYFFVMVDLLGLEPRTNRL